MIVFARTFFFSVSDGCDVSVWGYVYGTVVRPRGQRRYPGSTMTVQLLGQILVN
jgi:hypothetical protein